MMAPSATLSLIFDVGSAIRRHCQQWVATRTSAARTKENRPLESCLELRPRSGLFCHKEFAPPCGPATEKPHRLERKSRYAPEVRLQSCRDSKQPRRNRCLDFSHLESQPVHRPTGFPCCEQLERSHRYYQQKQHGFAVQNGAADRGLQCCLSIRALPQWCQTARTGSPSCVCSLSENRIGGRHHFLINQFPRTVPDPRSAPSDAQLRAECARSATRRHG